MIALATRMIRKPIAATVVAVGIVVCEVSREATAQDYHRGIVEYEIACMPCHGIAGRGDGRLAKALKTPPADLTRIARANKGVFPSRRIAEIIDGRTIVAGHGKREMPAWGDRYSAPVSGETAAMVEKRVRAQINALAEYLRSIQE